MSIEEVAVYKCKCERCEHKWITKTKDMPKVCPKCKSPYWNVPRKKSVK